MRKSREKRAQARGQESKATVLKRLICSIIFDRGWIWISEKGQGEKGKGLGGLKLSFSIWKKVLTTTADAATSTQSGHLFHKDERMREIRDFLLKYFD